MKILMLSAEYLPKIGGMAAHVHHLSRALISLGHTVTVVTSSPSSDTRLDVERNEGLTVYRPHYIRTGRRWQNIIRRTSATKQAMVMAESDMGVFDILHHHDYYVSVFAARYGSKASPWIFTNHSSLFLLDYKKTFMRWAVKQLFRPADGVIAVSQEILQKSAHLWSKHAPVIYIPNGLDPQPFKPTVIADELRAKYGISPDNFVVLCPRRIVEKNGVDYLADAVNQVLQKWTDIPWKFIFVATDNTDTDGYIAQVKSKLSAAHENGKALLLGDLDLEAMVEVNALADVVVIPSLVEAVSLSALEAMASRKPVIASNVGGLPEIIEDGETGLLVPPRDPQALAAAMVKLYQDESTRNKIAEGGFKLSTEHYGWIHIAQMTIEFYQSILSQDTQHESFTN